MLEKIYTHHFNVFLLNTEESFFLPLRELSSPDIFARTVRLFGLSFRPLFRLPSSFLSFSFFFSSLKFGLEKLSTKRKYFQPFHWYALNHCLVTATEIEKYLFLSCWQYLSMRRIGMLKSNFSLSLAIEFLRSTDIASTPSLWNWLRTPVNFDAQRNLAIYFSCLNSGKGTVSQIASLIVRSREEREEKDSLLDMRHYMSSLLSSYSHGCTKVRVTKDLSAQGTPWPTNSSPFSSYKSSTNWSVSPRRLTLRRSDFESKALKCKKKKRK